jgi:hypothetical protein
MALKDDSQPKVREIPDSNPGPQDNSQNFGQFFKNISNRRNYQLMRLILTLILRNSTLQHAVDYSENSNSGIAELLNSGRALRKK